MHPLLNTQQAADSLGLSRRTLERWRLEGNGPVFVKLGRRCLYKQSDLVAWVQSNLRRSTSDSGQAVA